MDARAWDLRYAAGAHVVQATPNALLVAELADLDPGLALDAACGEGRHALWLASRGWRVIGVDFSAVALRRARQLALDADVAESVEWRTSDVLDIETEATFDLALLSYLQLEAAERRAAVRRAFVTLRPGGTFLLIGHDSTNLVEGTGGPQDPAVLYTCEEVLGDLDGERFEVQRAERVTRAVRATVGGHEHAGDPALTAYDAMVRLVRLA